MEIGKGDCILLQRKYPAITSRIKSLLSELEPRLIKQHLPGFRTM